MIGKLIIEILILWIIYALYMAILVHKRGPLGGIFFYPKVMQERVIEIGLMTERELKRRRTFAYMFLGAEFFDWLVIDTIWVALSDWWIIPGTEDLNDTWHSVHVKKWKMLQLIPFSIPISAIIGGLYWGIRILSL